MLNSSHQVVPWGDMEHIWLSGGIKNLHASQIFLCMHLINAPLECVYSRLCCKCSLLYHSISNVNNQKLKIAKRRNLAFRWFPCLSRLNIPSYIFCHEQSFDPLTNTFCRPSQLIYYCLQNIKIWNIRMAPLLFHWTSLSECCQIENDYRELNTVWADYREMVKTFRF